MSKETDDNFEALKALVSDHIELITVTKSSFREAIERATKFLVVSAILADHKLDLEKRKAKVTTLRDAMYSHAITTAEGKTITEKKLGADMDTGYTNQREAVEEIEAEVSWVKLHFEIFNNAHVTYRQMSKGE